MPPTSRGQPVMASTSCFLLVLVPSSGLSETSIHRVYIPFFRISSGFLQRPCHSCVHPPFKFTVCSLTLSSFTCQLNISDIAHLPPRSPASPLAPGEVSAFPCCCRPNVQALLIRCAPTREQPAEEVSWRSL